MIQMHKTRNVVHLQAFNTEGRRVFEETLTVHKFYEKPHEVLDRPDFRRAAHIVRLTGVIYDATGTVSQEFQACFDASGLCVCEAARFADGTTVGAWEELQPAGIESRLEHSPSQRRPFPRESKSSKTQGRLPSTTRTE
jgi:hypothetical protein